MKFERLAIENFLTIGDAVLDLADKGLVLVQGVNEDDSSATSNGVGKSSIPDALCWACYGTTARDESGDAVVNRTAKKNTKVSVQIRDGSSLYRITRHRKHKEGKNSTVLEVSADNGITWLDLSKGTEKETQEEIVKVMGCSHEVFRAAIYAGQEDMPDIPKMTDKQLKMLIEEAAGVERIEAAYVIARSKHNAALAEQARNQALLDANKQRQEQEAVALETAKDRHREFESLRPARVTEAQKRADDIRAKLVAQVGTIKTYDKAALEAESGALYAQLAGHKTLTDHAATLQAALSSAEREKAVAASNAEAATKKASAAKSALENAAEELKKPCSECGKPHTAEELETLKDHLRSKLNAALVEYRDAVAKLATATEKAKDADAEHKAYLTTIPDVGETNKRKSEVAVQLMELSRLSSQAASLKKDYDQAVLKVGEVHGEPNPQESAIAMIQERQDALKSAQGALETALDDSTQLVTITDAVVSVFGPSGVRAHILDTVTPFLNERTAEYLSALSDGNIHATWNTLSETAKGELREKFNVEVTNDKGADSFKGLSGGEKRKVRLATMLALQDMVAARATKPISIWVGDEIDDALDPAGLERLMGILDRKSRERGTVIVVSHAELRDWIDDVAVVTKRGGFSTVEGALNA